MHNQRIFISVIFFPPYSVAQGVNSYNTASFLRQLLQNCIFFCRQRKFAVPHCLIPVFMRYRIPVHQAAPHVYLTFSKRNHFLLHEFYTVHPFEHRRHPQNQFLRQKRLCDIIIRAKPQPPQSALILIPRRKKNDRHFRYLPQPLKKGKTVPVRKHHIQKNQMRAFGKKPFLGLPAVFCRRHMTKTRMLQKSTHHFPQCFLIVYQQNFTVI